ncbi:small integral membrane protein 15-like [Tenrec ecaudatus]|uniref:small integral membrane protein 15-like n=1 Tax=Tenrec ecaudatus TaxID=94439 RepID=UPI003F5A23D1
MDCGACSDLTGVFAIKARAEYMEDWASKDLRTVIRALTPLFLARAVLSWKLAKMTEARGKEQQTKPKGQENIAQAKQLQKD